ncbi:MAG: hypothetical protein HPY66_1177 [Firmicutes bacterium]|nr:hypothetical protein [Bacillota bacterium]
MVNKVFIVPDYQDDRFSLKEIKSIHQLQDKFKKHFHEDYSIQSSPVFMIKVTLPGLSGVTLA